ncbi:hypothetical protein HERIO_1212 [Hepatospora eriocheir]|uniref:Uncharacterized protein n=1 Tax=Hepatospora eriocheir TaxID=1081669 RepID=A0A1X0QAP2_9MICR|nr:hypothetical protein HERIO_1212 [Hepatospora eriocheir]
MNTVTSIVDTFFNQTLIKSIDDIIGETDFNITFIFYRIIDFIILRLKEFSNVKRSFILKSKKIKSELQDEKVLIVHSLLCKCESDIKILKELKSLENNSAKTKEEIDNINNELYLTQIN